LPQSKTKHSEEKDGLIMTFESIWQHKQTRRTNSGKMQNIKVNFSWHSVV